MKEMETNIINLKIFEKNVKEEKILVIIKVFSFVFIVY